VSPLLKNKPELVEYANTKVFAPLKAEFGRVIWDDNGNIGKRYRRQDEIGTPFCIVVDFDTLTDDTVTVRDRDTGKQERIKVENIKNYIKEKI
jgi:glycyl-tRNA synthetase